MESSWTPRDLTDALSGRGVPPPGICRLDSGPALFYEGRINGLHGEPECGKSWIAWITVAQLLLEGRPACYLDYEDTEAGAVQRLRALGVPDERIISDLFAYVRPEEPISRDTERPFGLLVGNHFAAVIIDSANESMVLEGLDPNDNKESGLWMRRVIRPFMESGAAVVMIDHVAKNKETRGNWAIGAQQKRAMIRGASYAVENRKPFGRGLEGHAVINLAKDTPGAIRERLAGRISVAELSILSDPITHQVSYTLISPVSYRVQLREKMRSYLLLHPGAGKREMRDLGKSDVVDDLLDELIADGVVKVTHDGPRHSHHWVE
jgi:hypothetical protein